MNYEEISI